VLCVFISEDYRTDSDISESDMSKWPYSPAGSVTFWIFTTCIISFFNKILFVLAACCWFSVTVT